MFIRLGSPLGWCYCLSSVFRLDHRLGSLIEQSTWLCSTIGQDLLAGIPGWAGLPAVLCSWVVLEAVPQCQAGLLVGLRQQGHRLCSMTEWGCWLGLLPTTSHRMYSAIEQYHRLAPRLSGVTLRAPLQAGLEVCSAFGQGYWLGCLNRVIRWATQLLRISG